MVFAFAFAVVTMDGAPEAVQVPPVGEAILSNFDPIESATRGKQTSPGGPFGLDETSWGPSTLWAEMDGAPNATFLCTN